MRIARLRLIARVFPIVFRSSPNENLVRLGSKYGGWWVPADGLGRNSICYCVGVGEDATLDLALIERLHCEVVSLDPTPKAVSFMSTLDLPSQLRFVPVGIAGSDREARFFEPAADAYASFSMANLRRTDGFIVAPVRTLRSVMAELGHETVDLLKLDIEGAEYEVLDSLHRDDLYPPRLCIEFDQPYPILDTWRAIRRLRRAGYQTVKVERFNVTFVRRPYGAQRHVRPAS
jgi:FkbM family methyltransferase